MFCSYVERTPQHRNTVVSEEQQRADCQFFVFSFPLSYTFKSLRHCVSAGEPINPEVMEKWKAQTGLDIYEGYGQTETVCSALQMWKCVLYRCSNKFYSGCQEKWLEWLYTVMTFRGKVNCNKQLWKNVDFVNHETIITALPKIQGLFFIPVGFGLGTNTEGVCSSLLHSKFCFKTNI